MQREAAGGCVSEDAIEDSGKWAFSRRMRKLRLWAGFVCIIM